MTKSQQLGELQLAILRTLWARGEATVSEVHAALFQERGLAPTTIATMLKKMEKRGLVAHRREARRFVYRPVHSQQQMTRKMVADLTNRLFDGNVGELVSHLINEHEIDADELSDLTELIAHAENKGEE